MHRRLRREAGRSTWVAGAVFEVFRCARSIARAGHVAAFQYDSIVALEAFQIVECILIVWRAPLKVVLRAARNAR